MADSKISALTAAASLASTDEFVIATSGATKRVTFATLVETLLPWTIDIDPFTLAATNTNWSGFAVDAAATYLNGGTRESSGAQNAEVGWDVILAAGTWTLQLLSLTHNQAGIVTAKIDGSDIGTMDLYSASLTYNVSKSVVDFVVAATGKKRLLLKMATKNASSSSYYGELSALRLLRTA